MTGKKYRINGRGILLARHDSHARENPRAGKVAERIHQIVAARLERGLGDRGMGFVTITDVRVTGDLQQATIFYTVLDDERRESTAQVLRKATGLLRSEVGRGLGTRLTPKIEFVADALPASANHMNDLLRMARERDEQTKRQASAAEYAGAEDPYVHKEQADDSADASAAAEGVSHAVEKQFLVSPDVHVVPGREGMADVSARPPATDFSGDAS